MKRLTSLLLLTAPLLYGGINPTTPITLPYDQSPLIRSLQQVYAQGAYERLITQAQHTTHAYANPALHLLWAKSAEALGRVEEAMAGYERVLILDPSHHEARTALERIYTQTHREALLSYQEGVPPHAPNFQAKLSLGVGYDDNTNASASASDLDSYYGLIGSEGSQSSLFGSISGTLDYRYYLDATSPWYLQATLDLDSQHNVDAHTYDLLVGRGGLGVGYKTDRYELYLPLGYTMVEYLDSHLLDRTTFAPSWLLKLDPQHYIALSGYYQQTRFQNSHYRDQESDTLGGSLSYYHLFSPTTLLKGSVEYTTQEPHHSSAIRYVDLDTLSATLQLKQHLTSHLTLKSHLLTRLRTYEDTIGTATITSSTSREDRLYEGGVTLRYHYREDLSLYLQDHYSLVDSNYLPAEYHKNQVMLGITTHF